MQETKERRIRSLGQEDLLEEGMAPHSNILALRIPWIEEPGGLQSIESKESDMTEATQHAGARSRELCRGQSITGFHARTGS